METFPHMLEPPSTFKDKCHEPGGNDDLVRTQKQTKTSLQRKSPFVPGSRIQYISSRSMLCNLKNKEQHCTTLNQFQSNMEDCFKYCIYSTRFGKLWIHSMKITLIFHSFFRTQSRFRPTRWRALIFNDDLELKEKTLIYTYMYIF